MPDNCGAIFHAPAVLVSATGGYTEASWRSEVARPSRSDTGAERISRPVVQELVEVVGDVFVVEGDGV